MFEVVNHQKPTKKYTEVIQKAYKSFQNQMYENTHVWEVVEKMYLKLSNVYGLSELKFVLRKKTRAFFLWINLQLSVVKKA